MVHQHRTIKCQPSSSPTRFWSSSIVIYCTWIFLAHKYNVLQGDLSAYTICPYAKTTIRKPSTCHHPYSPNSLLFRYMWGPLSNCRLIRLNISFRKDSYSTDRKQHLFPPSSETRSTSLNCARRLIYLVQKRWDILGTFQTLNMYKTYIPQTCIHKNNLTIHW